MTPRGPLAAAASWLAARLPTWALLGLYRLGPVTRLLRSLLNRSVPPGITEVRVAGGQLAGVRLLLNLREEKDLWLGSYEPFMLEAIARYARPGMIAYDVGAHIGYVTLCLAQAVGPEGRVVAFEPLPANLERLRANLALNGLSERVQVVAAAVGETSGHQRFRLHSSVAMGKLIQPNETGDAVLDVKVVSLDDLAAERVQPPNLLKMDIEGGEVAALRGMRRMLRDAGPMLLIEIHGAQAAKGVWGEFQLADYAVYRLGGGVSRLTSAPEVRERGHLLGLPASRSGEVVGA